jgi:hypothetical protein
MGHYEAGVLQHLEVLHHTEPRHLQLGLELGQRAAVTLEEPVEQEPPGRVRERLEHAVVLVGHHQKIGDPMVTCQRAPKTKGTQQVGGPVRAWRRARGRRRAR